MNSNVFKPIAASFNNLEFSTPSSEGATEIKTPQLPGYMMKKEQPPAIDSWLWNTDFQLEDAFNPGAESNTGMVPMFNLSLMDLLTQYQTATPK